MTTFFKYFTLLILVFFSFNIDSWGQSLHGKIFDKETNEGVSHASIYLPELNVLTSSDSIGTFHLKNIKKGKYIIQISHIGFEPYINTIAVSDSVTHIEFYLQATLLELSEIVIYGTQSSELKKTSFNIASMSLKEMKENGAYSISDAVAKIPGMNQINTGVGISKPVIRGLYGNRIQTVLMGIRFDNQQWQDEHGLGLSDVGVDRIEIIKGPASLMYGSEAMGGVLDIIEEKPAEVGKTKIDLNTQFFSNTLGNATNLGWKKSTEKRSFRIRGGYESQGDYSDGNNNRVLNTRYKGYHIKTSASYKSAKRVTTINFMSSLSKFGFVSEDNIDKKEPDARISRKMDGPNHTVFFNVLTAQNTYFREKSKIKWNVGTHSNLRLENEGGNKISLNMLLNTFASDLQWTWYLSKKIELTAGTQEMYQTNRNYGSRVIVPNANLWEAGLFTYAKYLIPNFTLEAGIRYDHKNVSTVSAITNPISNVQVLPFSRQYNVMNGSLGSSIVFWERFNLKMNASTGYRAPNLAELASNGLHEGTYRVEVGNPNMKAEQNLNLESSLTYEVKDFSMMAAVYRNHIYNYIYLAPTGLVNIYPVYQYIQKTSTIQGGEVQMVFHPKWFKLMQLTSSYSNIQGKTDAGENLPFIPANRLMGELRFNFEKIKKTKPYFKAGVIYTFAQDKPAQFETSTPDYYLVNAGLGGILPLNKMPLTFILSGNNLLNKTYFDHLSRFKYYNIYNIGRNFTLTIQIPIK